MKFDDFRLFSYQQKELSKSMAEPNPYFGFKTVPSMFSTDTNVTNNQNQPNVSHRVLWEGKIVRM